MPTKPVQISLDRELLRQIDRDPEVKRSGRSAFIRNAIALYLRARERRAVDAAIEKAYAGHADEMLAEADALIGSQAWPEK